MTAGKFRSLALSLDEVVEASHMNHPDFRVGGRIFATLGPGGKGGEKWGMVKLDLDHQAEVLNKHPDMFEVIPGAWGRQGCTRVLLETATAPIVLRALKLARKSAAAAMQKPAKRKKR